MRTLVVDTLPVARRGITGVLKKMDSKADSAKITEVHNGQTALDALEREPFDLVITEWALSDFSGLELLQKIRANPRYGKIAVIIVSAQQDKESIMAAMQAGVSSYVVKPFTPATLETRIRAVIQARKQAKAASAEPAGQVD